MVNGDEVLIMKCFRALSATTIFDHNGGNATNDLLVVRSTDTSYRYCWPIVPTDPHTISDVQLRRE
jgi:hypothetical protein